MESVKAISGIASNLCPRCRQGKVFKGLYRMRARCGECNLDFEPESGYYLGAMIFSYAFGTFSIIPTVVAMVFWAEAPLSGIVLVPSLQLILMNPWLFKFSRLAWLHLDHAADPG